jgi:DNA-binding MarR family transcriptional regulator
MTTAPSDAAVAAWARLVRAQQGVVAKVEADLRRAGFPPLVWYDILLELERADAGRLRQREIQRRMLLKRYNVSRLVERMEREGLVAREPCDDDARGATARITDKGRALRRNMWPAYADAIARNVSSRLSDPELKTLSRLLARLTA